MPVHESAEHAVVPQDGVAVEHEPPEHVCPAGQFVSLVYVPHVPPEHVYVYLAVQMPGHEVDVAPQSVFVSSPSFTLQPPLPSHS